MAAGAVIAGAVISAGGKVYGGLQAKKAAEKQANLLKQQALLEREAAEFEALQQERGFEKLLGRQKLSIAASGIKLEGSPLDLLKETLKDKEETINNIIRSGEARVGTLTSQARNINRQGRNALVGSIFSALGGSVGAISKFK